MPTDAANAQPRPSIHERLSSACRLVKAAGETVLLRTHVRKWQRVAEQGPPTWDERNMIIARFVPAGSSVLDLGSGAQTLRTHLPAGCRYQPCDVVKISPDVIFCDFNQDIYPEVSEIYDCVICSGILEYVRKPKIFIDRVSRLGRTMLLSYNPRKEGESKLERMGKHWVNHMRRDVLEKWFDDLGLQWKVVNTREPNEYLYSITRGRT